MPVHTVYTRVYCCHMQQILEQNRQEQDQKTNNQAAATCESCDSCGPGEQSEWRNKKGTIYSAFGEVLLELLLLLHILLIRTGVRFDAVTLARRSLLAFWFLIFLRALSVGPTAVQH